MQGRFEEAIEDYTKAVALNPRHCRAFYNRAFSYDRLQQFEAAIADYSRALEIEPTNATAFHNRASLLERSGRSGLGCLTLMWFEPTPDEGPILDSQRRG